MKCHFRDRKMSMDDYPNSPHVQDKIAWGRFPLCHQQSGPNSSFTDDISKVTCVKCLELLSKEEV